MKLSKKVLLEVELSLPIIYTRGSCEEELDNRLKNYVHVLRRHCNCPQLETDVEEFRISLMEMYREYYLGHHNKAYSIFKKAIEALTKNEGLFSTELPREPLYRARVNAHNRDYDTSEMFHIKLSDREKVKPQRFSFPGLPCLYLGGSSYVCWLELNRPQLDHFQLSIIVKRNKEQHLKVIDLGIPPQKYYEMLASRQDAKTDSDLYRYLKWWPVMASCSIAVLHEDCPFKAEYVVPQFMLEYLLEESETYEQYIGIRYMSIKAGEVSRLQYEAHERIYTNYVIPIRSVEQTSNGCCQQLDGLFKVFRTKSGRELQILSDAIRLHGVTWQAFPDSTTNKHADSKEVLYGSDSDKIPYSRTYFARIEEIMTNKEQSFNGRGEYVLEPLTVDDIEEILSQ